MLLVVDAAVGRHRRGRGRGPGAAALGTAGPAGRQQGRQRAARGRRLGVRLPGLGRPVDGERAARPGDGRPPRRGRPAPARRGGARRRSRSRRRRRHVRTAATRPRRRPTPPPSGRGASWAGPTSGKSTLFNRMLGEERSVVHDLPGTTRDAIDTLIETADGPIRFIDTAGMRRRSRTEDGHRVLRHGAGPAGPRPCRRGAARHRRHRRGDPSGPTPRRADRRLGQPGRRRPQQVGAARHREPARRRRRRRRPPRLPRRRARRSR